MTRWQTALRGADRRELPLVAGLAALLVADGLYRAEGELTPAAVGAVALVTVPLLWRRSAPQLALIAIVAGVFACLATLTPYDVVGVPLVIAAYSVAVAGDRLRSAATAVIVVAAAIVDATIVRMILVPAIMELLGDKAWWAPRWLKRLVPEIHVEGGAPQPATA